MKKNVGAVILKAVLHQPHKDEPQAAMLVTRAADILTGFCIHVPMEANTGIASRLVLDLIRLSLRKKETNQLLMRIAAHGEYLYSHSVQVAMVSMLLANTIRSKKSSLIELAGLAGLLHDAGMLSIDAERVDSHVFFSATNPARNEEVQQHLMDTAKELERVDTIPDEVRYAIYQQHEEPGGLGFPNGLTDEVIFYPAKILAVANAFVEHMTERNSKKAYTPEHALEVMRGESGRFDQALMNQLEEILGLAKAA